MVEVSAGAAAVDVEGINSLLIAWSTVLVTVLGSVKILGSVTVLASVTVLGSGALPVTSCTTGVPFPSLVSCMPIAPVEDAWVKDWGTGDAAEFVCI